MLDRLHTCLTLLDARTCTGFFVSAKLFVYVAWLLTSPGHSAFLNISQLEINQSLSSYKESIEFVMKQRHRASDIDGNESCPSEFFAVVVKTRRAS